MRQIFSLWLAIQILIFSFHPMPFMTQDIASAYLAASNYQPQLGEPIELVLRVELDQSERISPLELYDMDVWQEPFQLVEIGEITETLQGATVLYEQKLTVVIWRTGIVSTPELTVKYANADLSVSFLTIAPITFDVISILSSATDLETIRPLKPNIVVTYLNPTVIIICLGGLLLAGLIFWKYVLNDQFPSAKLKMGLKPKIVTEVDSLSDPAILMYQSIQKLRSYLIAEFEESWGDLPTREILQRIENDTHLSPQKQAELRHLLLFADQTKFAHIQLSLDEVRQYARSVQKWIESVSVVEE